MDSNDIYINPERLEISKENMKLGNAYIFVRTDGSFMLYSNRESYGNRWFAQDWFDINKNFIQTEVQTTCILSPTSTYPKEEIDFKETISGTYSISVKTKHLIENSFFKAFTLMAPITNEINTNIRYYEFNKTHEQHHETTYIKGTLDDNNILFIEPGTCLIELFPKNSILNLTRIKNQIPDYGNKMTNCCHYVTDQFSIDYSKRTLLSHWINNDSFFMPKKYEKECILVNNKNCYIIPSDVFDDFNTKYIRAVEDIQNVRWKILNTILENHKKLYGLESCIKAQNQIFNL